MTYLSLLLALLAPLVVVWSFLGSGQLIALGAHAALMAFAVAARRALVTPPPD